MGYGEWFPRSRQVARLLPRWKVIPSHDNTRLANPLVVYLDSAGQLHWVGWRVRAISVGTPYPARAARWRAMFWPPAPGRLDLP